MMANSAFKTKTILSLHHDYSPKDEGKVLANVVKVLSVTFSGTLQTILKFLGRLLVM